MPKVTYKNYREERPWGSFTQFALNEPVTVKIITVKAGEALSLQSHEKRAEFWRIISGDGVITIGEAGSAIKAGEDYEIPPETKHRVEAGSDPVVILEVSRGDFDEHDIIRFRDKYGRAAAD
ncbi:MAG: phosphomannose isomerase type II C-terminal cupin domain [Candidatus Taylorbacteria bacterium]|nr:phosphomannose isomerase type II C-terminal cupin domain [Candidatus Taylorbacteria bacterium]